MDDLWPFLLTAGAAALASPAGGVLSLHVRPTSLLLSIAVGAAGGVLLVPSVSRWPLKRSSYAGYSRQ